MSDRGGGYGYKYGGGGYEYDGGATLEAVGARRYGYDE
jgi:hypothetical protein